MNDFVSAPEPSGGIKWEDHKGSLLVVEPLSLETGITTAFGEKDAIRANVYVLRAEGSEDYLDTLIFPLVLLGQLKGQIGKKVVGRLATGIAKPGQKPPWKLDAATPEDLAKAQAWLAAASLTSAAAPF